MSAATRFDIRLLILDLTMRTMTTMTMLTSEERENTHCAQKILYICMESIDQQDMNLLERLRAFLAPDIVMSAPALVDVGVTMWEMEGLEQVIHLFDRIFIDLQLTTLAGSKPMVNLLARNRSVVYNNKVVGLAIMAEGSEFVPRASFVQRHTLELQSGYVTRWTIDDDPVVLDDLANFFPPVSLTRI